MQNKEANEEKVREQTSFAISRKNFDAVIFDLDGVVTRTAGVHAAAWKELFDRYFKERGTKEGREYGTFDQEADYRQYVDGKPRYDGVKSFLESRGISLPEGDPDDPPGEETICALGNKKNELFLEELKRLGVEAYDSTVALIRALRTRGFKTAIISASKNCGPVLETAGLTDLFDVKVDGIDSADLGIQGKPAPDIFVEAARRLKVDPGRAIVIEDALAGVEAARRGGFGRVIGVDRAKQEEALREHGADIVVQDLAEIGIDDGENRSYRSSEELPSARERFEEIADRARRKRLAVFLDYDGTLTPIVDRPDHARLSDDMRDAMRGLAHRATIAVISGRDLKDVRTLIGIDDIFYAGSHGFDIAGPQGEQQVYQEGTAFLPVLGQAERELRERLDRIHGALVERKRFSIAVHYRKVPEQSVADVEAVVDDALSRYPSLRKTAGKKVFELQPKIEWHKGKALRWLLGTLGLDRPDVLPFYIGDDITDEDAFAELEDCGIGIVVRDEPRPTRAAYALDHPDDVKEFLTKLTNLEQGGSG